MTADELDEDWSVPETEVLHAIERTLDAGGGVLATIVGVEGNAYRRPGAKMVVSRSGVGVGSITAGCLEDEVRDIAAAVEREGENRVERFDLTAQDDVWGLGLGCNGVIDILFEPIEEDYRQVVDAFHEGDDAVLCTVLASDADEVPIGDRGLGVGRDPEDAVDHDWPVWLREGLKTPLAALLDSATSETVTVEHDGATVEVFIDVVTAPPKLLIFGTGHDVGPVTELGRLMDFDVTVVSFRGSQADPDRFPEADRVRSMSPPDIAEELPLDGDTYAVVMTHNFVDDRLTLEELFDTPVPYIGLMGPDERFQEMLKAFQDEGNPPKDTSLESIYTPIGLDLGGGTPYQIAMSIVGEVQAVASGREPKHLRERAGPIHDRLDG